jgi:hypothetical protein
VLTPETFVPLGDLEIALCATVPPANASVAQLEEPTAASYARQVYPAGVEYWAPTEFGELYNTLTVEFPIVLEDSWGVVTGYALVDPVSGQCLSVGSLLEPYEATVGMVPRLEAGVLQLGIYD